jgi:uncharacterized protein
MDYRFMPHNTHLEGLQSFLDNDPTLKRLNTLKVIYRSPLIDKLPRFPGIYSITGGRQIGKTTLVKQWMASLLEKSVSPESISYFTGELIDDHHTLVRIIMESLEEMGEGIRYILLDEVTYIKGWDKGVKYLADAGMLENVVMVLTGSDMVILKEARMRLPGRRGREDEVNFHLYPLSFKDTVKLKGNFNENELAALAQPTTDPLSADNTDLLFKEFDQYLLHGGFLTAINDMAENGAIRPATYFTYSDWIRGDVLKRGKQEHYLREIVAGILKRYASQVTWNNFLADLSIDHPKTVADYIAILESMDAAYVQSALREDQLSAAPKKARKVMFTDPFIYHALQAWIQPCKDPYNEQAKKILKDTEMSGKLVEACVVTHFRRKFPTYYIKGKGEVDIAYIDKEKFWPIEIKWTGQIRPKDLKQVVKYPNGRIWSRMQNVGVIQDIPSEPLPIGLFRLEI